MGSAAVEMMAWFHSITSTAHGEATTSNRNTALGRQGKMLLEFSCLAKQKKQWNYQDVLLNTPKLMNYRYRNYGITLERGRMPWKCCCLQPWVSFLPLPVKQPPHTEQIPQALSPVHPNLNKEKPDLAQLS